jgi:type VII secretion-associated serine protease mycosin
VAMDAPAAGADSISDGQWFHSALNTAAAHSITQGEGVTVGLIDSGVDGSHPDLSGSLLSGLDLVGQTDGRVDTNGHGTAMAGLIAAHGRVKGVAPLAKILPVKITAVSDAPIDKQAQGIRWAVANGAKVISISRSGPFDDLLLRQQVEAAIAADVVVVAAAGNKPDATDVEFPAAVSGVVAVAATNRDGNLSDISVAGPQLVVSAPGEKISSTGPKATHYVGSGTSYATAIVAGAVALIRAKFPNLKAPEVIRRLTATATDKGTPGRDSTYGYGVLNIVGALTADLPQVTSAPATSEKPRPQEPSGFPWWWLLAIIPVAGIVLAVVLTARRR